MVDRAHGFAFDPQKTASRVSEENPNIHARLDLWLTADLQRDTEWSASNTVSDVHIGPNLYTYVRQNPWTFFDPLGLERFSAKVMNKLQSIDDILMQRNSSLFYENKVPSNLERRVVLKFIGEEFATRKGGKAAIDFVQDSSALVFGAVAEGMEKIRGRARFRSKLLPEGWIDGNIAQKTAARADFTLHDIGPANFKVRTAMELSGINPQTASQAQVYGLASALRTNKGTTGLSRAAFQQAYQDLNPLVSQRDIRNQVQLLVDYIRTGRDRFWQRVAANRGITLEQVAKWRGDPKNFKDSNGNTPKPLQPSEIDGDQFDQIDKLVESNEDEN